MLKKCVSLVAGVMIASVLALPAAATDGKPEGKGKGTPPACVTAIRDAAKTFHEQQVEKVKAFLADQKTAREAFRGQQPPPTEEQRKAFRAKHVEAAKTFRADQKVAREEFRAKQKAAREACKPTASM
jgi:lipoprotein-anchoring transpeptidase ErfK/SrfK